jgi:hypothetical protein
LQCRHGPSFSLDDRFHVRQPDTLLRRAGPSGPVRSFAASRVLLFLLLVLAPTLGYAGTITIAWDPSNTPELVAGYVVYYGTSSGNYTATHEVGNVTTTVVPGLTDGVRYYFVVRTYSSTFVLSTASNEVSGLPVPEPNTPPVITNPGNRTVREGPFTLPIVASDPDGDPLTYSASGLPAGLSIGASTGVITGTASPGSWTITVTVRDGSAEASTTFALTVTPNDRPTLAAPGNQTNDTNDNVSLQLSASDADGDTLTFSATGLPANLTLNASTGLITGIPTSPGVHPVTVTVSDGSLAASQSFTWTVTQLPPSPPVSHWRLDLATGTTAVDSGGTRHGTLTNGASWTAGHSGNAVVLDGVDDYVALPTFDLAGSQMSIAVWVRSSSFSSAVGQRFLAKASGTAAGTTYWMLGHADSGGVPRLRFRLRTGTSTATLTATSGNLPLNTWYHAVATYDGSMMRLYLNGVQVGSLAKTGVIATSAAVPVSIGRSPEGSNYAHGAIDDVRVFDRALTAGEVTTLMNEPVNRSPVVVNPGNRIVNQGSFALAISASDPDGDALSYAALGLPAGTSISAATGVITGTVQPGIYSVTVTADDGEAQGAASFTLTVVQSSFTDHPLVAGVHVMRALHVTELRTRINALRASRGMAPASWTDPLVVSGVTMIRAVHVTELRSALRSVYVAAGRPAPVFTDESLSTGMAIRAVHINELRAAVIALE